VTSRPSPPLPPGRDDVLVELLAPNEALDEGLVEQLVRLINGAYALGEAGLWHVGATRIQPREIAAAIRNHGLIAASLEGRLVGCAYVRQLDAGTADLGLISTATDSWGSGIGRELVRSAEELMRSRGVTTMQLELLVPKDGSTRRRTSSARGTRGSATGSFDRRRSRRSPRTSPHSSLPRARPSSSTSH
jgi:hypothetical protein